MCPLPPQKKGQELVVWRIDSLRFANSWDSGVGAERLGGRWNTKGKKAVYCSIDASTAIVEVAVHRGFDYLDTEPSTLTRAVFKDFSLIHVVHPHELPNPLWRLPVIPSLGQMKFGTHLLDKHGAVLFPSCVSGYSWNLVFDPDAMSGHYYMSGQERLGLDGRLSKAA
jgi:RES domain-containing protein